MRVVIDVYQRLTDDAFIADIYADGEHVAVFVEQDREGVLITSIKFIEVQYPDADVELSGELPGG